MAFEEGVSQEEITQDLSQEVSNEDTGGGGQPQNQFSVSPDQWEQLQTELSSLKQAKQGWEQKQSSYENDLKSYKEEMSQLRENERKARLLQLGDPDTIQEEKNRRHREQIKKELQPYLKELLPELVQSGQVQIGGNSRLADQVYFNQASERVHKMAKDEGFDDKGAKAMEAFGSFLVESVPDWKHRFYNGDIGVIQDIEKFIKKTILEPRDKYIENRVLERIRKQGKYAAPIPKSTGGSGVKQKPSLKQDLTNVDNRRSAFLKLASSVRDDN